MGPPLRGDVALWAARSLAFAARGGDAARDDPSQPRQRAAAAAEPGHDGLRVFRCVDGWGGGSARAALSRRFLQCFTFPTLLCCMFDFAIVSNLPNPQATHRPAR